MKKKFFSLILLAWTFSLHALDLPPEFEDVLVLDQLIDPASMAFAPDGRLFYGERINGNIRVAKYDALRDTWTVEPIPFYHFDVPAQRHRSSGLHWCLSLRQPHTCNEGTNL